jgi:hypothetical protein
MLAGKEIAKVSSQAASCTPTVQEFRIQSDAGDAYTIGIPLVWTNVKRKRYLRKHSNNSITSWNDLTVSVSSCTAFVVQGSCITKIDNRMHGNVWECILLNRYMGMYWLIHYLHGPIHCHTLPCIAMHCDCSITFPCNLLSLFVMWTRLVTLSVFSFFGCTISTLNYLTSLCFVSLCPLF